MLFLKKHKITILFSSLFLIFGLFIGTTINDYPNIRLDNSIDLAEVLNVIISILTLLIAFYIANTIDRKKRKEEYELNYVFSKLKEINSLSSDFIITISSNNCPISLVNSKLKSISIAYIDIKNILEICNFPITMKEDKEILKLNQYIRRLATESRKYTYNSNVISFQEERELNINQGVIEYSEYRIDEIKNYLSKFNNLLFKYAIN